MYLAARVTDFPSLKVTVEQMDKSPGYTILGPSGCGKTHLAVAILKEWIKSRRAAHIIGDRWGDTRPVPRYRDSAEFIPVSELLYDIKRGFNATGGPKAIARVSEVIGLVIDDLGAERETDWSGGVMYYILNHRLNACLPTIVTSNLGLEEFQASDPRVASRLAGLDVITLTGKDRRIS